MSTVTDIFLSSSTELHTGDSASINQGFFKGNIVKLFKLTQGHPLQRPFHCLMLLSKACPEVPVLTYHNGPKVVGMCYGNVQSRILASEVLEYSDKTTEYKETINRIVEFGRAHHVAAIVPYLQQNGIGGLHRFF